MTGAPIVACWLVVPSCAAGNGDFTVTKHRVRPSRVYCGSNDNHGDGDSLPFGCSPATEDNFAVCLTCGTHAGRTGRSIF